MNNRKFAEDPMEQEITIKNVGAPKLKALAETLTAFTEFEDHPVEGIDLSNQAKSLQKDVPGGPKEPVYSETDQAEIQGNILPGFNKGKQHFLFFTIGNRKKAKGFLKWLLPYISSMKEVMSFRKLYRERRLQLGKRKTFLSSTNVNIALSKGGLEKLTSKSEAKKFGDGSFQLGLAARSTYLGDPSSRTSKGHASKWKVGGPDNEADLVVIVASDCEEHLTDLVVLIQAEAISRGLDCIFEQEGKTLPGSLQGHEHFGFKDGISQPGVRGKLSKAPGDYITPRYFKDTDERRLYFAKPGQLLTWPGQYLLGEPRQSTEDLVKKSSKNQTNFPTWAKRGSYLVIRRLRQDVPAFWTFAQTCAHQLGIDATEFASRLVGRWPSGAPLMRSPKMENTALGADEFANNHFLFDNDTAASKLKPIPGYSGDNFPPAMADFLAKVCPHFSHIRKVNPRESVTDLGKPEDNLARMILRRGIPYGTPLIGEERFTKKLCSEDRGLIFLCYGASIENQFEFLQRRWSNSPVQPNLDGHDPIIGQNGSGRSRERFIDFPLPSGGTTRISFQQDFVVPTGGGYFFAPSLVALRTVLTD